MPSSCMCVVVYELTVWWLLAIMGKTGKTVFNLPACMSMKALSYLTSAHMAARQSLCVVKPCCLFSVAVQTNNVYVGMGVRFGALHMTRGSKLWTVDRTGGRRNKTSFPGACAKMSS